MSIGCFGNSDIDRWMARNLDDYLDEGECKRTEVLLKTFRGKKLIGAIWVTISNADDCYNSMREVLVKMHTKHLKKYLDEFTKQPSLFSTPRHSHHTFYNPETGYNYYGTINKFSQECIVENWAMLPKEFHIINDSFNLLRMGKYSVVCNFPKQKD